jgi:cell division protein FtsZ
MKNNSPLVKIIGVGGCGCNTVSSIEEKYAGKLNENFEFYGVDTDFISLKNQTVRNKVEIGSTGIGTAKDRMLGAQAAQESADKLREMLKGADIVILCAGLSGGTGSGSTGVIAHLAASEGGAVVMASVTLPFYYDDVRKQEAAQDALKSIKEEVPVVMPVTNGEGVENEDVPFLEVLRATDNNVICLIEMINIVVNRAGYENLDFSELIKVASTSGDAMIGIGEAKGEQGLSLAINLARSTKSGSLTLKDAQRVALITLTSPNVSFKQIKDARLVLQNEISRQTEVYNGLYVDNDQEGAKVILFATGINSQKEIPSSVVEQTEAGPMKQYEIGFLAVEEGRFKDTAPTYIAGINYDKPTFIRKGVLIEK